MSETPPPPPPPRPSDAGALHAVSSVASLAAPLLLSDERAPLRAAPSALSALGAPGSAAAATTTTTAAAAVAVSAGALGSSLSLAAVRRREAQPARGFCVQPSLKDGVLCVVADGDAWLGSLRRGEAFEPRRLTTTKGLVASPALSPDGALVAYSCGAFGAMEVHVVRTRDGHVTRLTYEGVDCVVQGWLDDHQILFASSCRSPVPVNMRLYAVNMHDRRVREVPLDQASSGSVGADGTLVFTRLRAQGSATREYRGGYIQSLWQFDLSAHSGPATPMFPTDHCVQHSPLVFGDFVFYLADSNGYFNIFKAPLHGATESVQLTHCTEFDVHSFAVSSEQIVFSAGGLLYTLGHDDGCEPVEIQVELLSDFEQRQEQWITRPLNYLTSAHLSPDGNRVCLTARGQIYSAGLDTPLYKVSHHDGVRFRSAMFLSANSVLALSDESGEIEFVAIDAHGSGRMAALTEGSTCQRYSPVTSPDGLLFAFTDREQRLWLYNGRTRELRQLFQFSSPVPADGDVNFKYRRDDIAWHPNSSRFLITLPADNDYLQVHMFVVESGQHEVLTSDRFNSFSPCYSTDGASIFFLSDRQFASSVPNPFGLTSPDPYFDHQTCVMILTESVHQSPFHASSIRAGQLMNEREQAPRLWQAPIVPGNYMRVLATEKQLFLLSYTSPAQKQLTLEHVEIKQQSARAPTDETPKTLTKDVVDVQLCAARKKMLIRLRTALHIVAAAPFKKLTDDSQLALGEWKMRVHPTLEWDQMLRETWRMQRDLFYDPQMHGVDWRSVFERFEPLVDRIATRADLSLVLREMVSHLRALHMFVNGGDRPAPRAQVDIGTLGAHFSQRDDTSEFEIKSIYQANPELSVQSPLDRLAKAGDVVVAINGVNPSHAETLNALLSDTAQRPVQVTLRQPDDSLVTVQVRPLTLVQDAELRYSAWEYANRTYVEQRSRHDIAYVHLRAMGTSDIASFAREFFPAFRASGVIIDVRFNHGGNIDSYVLEKLSRKAWMFWKPRNSHVYWNMQRAFRGHMVVICNGMTCSDGEAFCEGFRRFELGPVIGTRTWGGGVWLDLSERFVDNGFSSSAEFGAFDEQGEWLVEGHGVDPDIVVDNEPFAAFGGRDHQLDAAIELLQRRIDESPISVPDVPAYPRKV